MEKFVVRLKEEFNEEIRTNLQEENIYVHHVAKLMKTLLIIETDKSYEELEQHPLFERVERNVIGRIDV